MKTKLIRTFKVVPGYVCAPGRCPETDCLGLGEHGTHCDDWIWIVSEADKREILCFTVYSGIYPVKNTVSFGPYGADLSLHVVYPTTKTQLLERPDPCAYVAGGKCYSAYSSVLDAKDLYERLGKPNPIGPEGQDWHQGTKTLWNALERRYRELRAAARQDRVDKTWEKCPHCRGKGVSRKTRIA